MTPRRPTTQSPTTQSRTTRFTSRAARIVFFVLLAAGTIGCGDDDFPDPWPAMPTNGTDPRKAYQGGAVTSRPEGFQALPDAGPADAK